MLIYFKTDEILRIAANATRALRDQGLLVVGESESLTSLDLPLGYLQPQIYQRTQRPRG